MTGFSAPEEPRAYIIAYARAELEGLAAGTDLGTALTESWRPGKAVVRYGRRWYLTRVLDEGPTFRFGRIGFVNDDEVTTLFFDPSTLDFVHGAAPAGVVVPFGFSTTTGVIAFQLRPGIVRETTFTGALESLLDEGLYIWSIRALV